MVMYSANHSALHLGNVLFYNMAAVRDEDISTALAARAKLLIRDQAFLNQTRPDPVLPQDFSREKTGKMIPSCSEISSEVTAPGEDATLRHNATRTFEHFAPFNGMGGHTSAGPKTPWAMSNNSRSAYRESDDIEPSKVIPDRSAGPGSAGTHRGT